jgi:putative transposase
VKCKLVLNETQALALTETMVKFAAACNEIAAYRDRLKLFHRFALSSFYYHYVREKYGLTANYCIQVFNRVAAQCISSTFKPTSITIDDHLFRYIEAKEEATLSAVGGRIRVKLAIGEYQRKRLKGWKVGAGTISQDQRTGQFYANICVNITEPAASGNKPLGVDLGIKRIATLSTGRMFSGRKLNRIRERYARTKANLQKKGTKGCKRALKRLSGREGRFQRDVNHVISKTVVATAKANDQFLCLEDLKGIKQRLHKQGKRSRRMLGRWAFYQLRTFLSYKSAEAGVRLDLVNPAYTSKTCPKCGERGHRLKLKFKCLSCGFAGDADIVGAINIAARGNIAKVPEVARI